MSVLFRQRFSFFGHFRLRPSPVTHLTQSLRKSLVFSEPSEIFRRIWTLLKGSLDEHIVYLPSKLSACECRLRYLSQHPCGDPQCRDRAPCRRISEVPPSIALLEPLIARMGITPRDLLREKGTPYAELGLGSPFLSEETLIDAMMAHLILINRPIVVSLKGVRLCRPSMQGGRLALATETEINLAFFASVTP